MNALQLSAEAQSLLDAHLDAVERVLLDAGLARSERQAICDEIQAQARDMLEARGAAPPTVEDMRAVLITMDPPESYSESALPMAPKVPAEPTCLHPAALWSVILPVAAFLLMLLSFGPKGEGAGLTFLGAAALIAVALGVASIVAIRRQPHCFRGVGLAVSGICFLPSVLLVTLSIHQWGPQVYWMTMADSIRREQETSSRDSMRAALRAEIEALDTQLNSEPAPDRREEIENYLAESRDRQAKMEQHFNATPIERLSGWDQQLIRNRHIVEALSNLLVLVPVLCLILLGHWLIYRFSRPPLSSLRVTDESVAENGRRLHQP